MAVLCSSSSSSSGVAVILNITIITLRNYTLCFNPLLYTHFVFHKVWSMIFIKKAPKKAVPTNAHVFGLCSAGSTFQSLMDVVLSGLSYPVALAFFDIIAFFGVPPSKTMSASAM